MPPKRKLANSGGPTSKRRANNEATPLEEANTAAMGQDPPQPLSSRSQAPIDYDLLAAAIIKQSQQPQSGTVTIAEPLQSPSNTTDHQPISHATTTGGAQSVNSSGIGALLDQVFLGRLHSGSSFESNTNGGSCGIFKNLSPVCRQLLSSSLSQSSVNAYRHAWDMLLAWKPKLSLPVSVVDVCNYIGNLFLKNYSASSIPSHLSAISYVHKILDLQDPTHTFITKKILKDCQASVPVRDTRLPIIPNILRKLLNALAHTVPQYFLRTLLRALFLLAFHTFLRLGEVAVKSLQKSHLVLQRQDVIFEYDGPRLASVQIIMQEHKTNKDHAPLVISLQAIPDSPFCPVNALFVYLNCSKHTSGPLFQTIDALPISYSKVSAHLKSAVQFIGLDPNNFKGHSFRIGAATYAASLRFSENLIQKLGRWNSDAFRRYIRINSFKL
ncbi:uncharacterized protein LOC144623177 [Crassostrea virginica]